MILNPKFTSNEIAKSSDFEKINEREIKNIEAILNEISAGTTKDSIVRGLTVQERGTPSMNVDITAGLGFCLSTSRITYNDSLFGPVAITNGGASDRIDTLEIRFLETDKSQEQRAFKNPSTGAITYQDIYTETEIEIEAQLIEGTEGSGIAPNHTSGWVKIAEIHVDAGETTSILDADIRNCSAYYEGEQTILWTAEKDATFITKNLSARIELAVTWWGDYSGDMNARVTKLFPWGSPGKLSNPSSLPADTGYGACWSPNGEFLAVAHVGTPFVIIYRRDGVTFTKLDDPAALPSGIGRGISWSPNGEFLAVAHSLSPFVTIYQRDGVTFTKLTNPASLPAGDGYGASWSSNGEFLAVAHNITPFITIYQRSGTTFTKLANPAALPSDISNGVSWSPNGEFLAVAHSLSPYITIYQRSGTTFTKLDDPAALPAGTGRGVSWSPNGEFLAVAHSLSPFVTIYQRDGVTFTKLTNPAALPASTGQGASFSPSGEFLAIAHVTTPFITIYQRSDTTFTKLDDPAVTPVATSYGVPFSPNGEFLAVAHNITPYITIYQTSLNMPEKGMAVIYGDKREGT